MKIFFFFATFLLCSHLSWVLFIIRFKCLQLMVYSSTTRPNKKVNFSFCLFGKKKKEKIFMAWKILRSSAFRTSSKVCLRFKFGLQIEPLISTWNLTYEKISEYQFTCWYTLVLWILSYSKIFSVVIDFNVGLLFHIDETQWEKHIFAHRLFSSFKY